LTLGRLRTTFRIRFVRKQRAFIGHFEAPDLLRNRTGKSTLLMTEQFAFQKIQRNDRAIKFYKSTRYADWRCEWRE
jgi:hypothetical protein